MAELAWTRTSRWDEDWVWGVISYFLPSGMGYGDSFVP